MPKSRIKKNNVDRVLNNERKQVLSALVGSLVLNLCIGIVFGTWTRSPEALISPIPDDYQPTFIARAAEPLEPIHAEDVNVYPDLSHIKPERQEIVEYIKTVFKDDAPKALLLLTGDGSTSSCKYGENHTLDPQATNTNRNGSTDTGIFQINSVHGIPQEKLTDYKFNVDYAYSIYKRQGFRPWTCAIVLGEENYLGYKN